MKKILSLIIVSLLILSGCKLQDSTQVKLKDNPQAITNDNGNKVIDCQSPINPYQDDGGHDAGFNWAEENNPSGCDGNSQSFIEGCEEYFRQLNQYNKCVAELNKK